MPGCHLDPRGAPRGTTGAVDHDLRGDGRVGDHTEVADVGLARCAGRGGVGAGDLRRGAGDEVHDLTGGSGEVGEVTEAHLVRTGGEVGPDAPLVGGLAVDADLCGDRRRGVHPQGREADEVTADHGGRLVEHAHGDGRRRDETGDVGVLDHVDAGRQLEPVEAPRVARDAVDDHLRRHGRVRRDAQHALARLQHRLGRCNGCDDQRGGEHAGQHSPSTPGRGPVRCLHASVRHGRATPCADNAIPTAHGFSFRPKSLRPAVRGEPSIATCPS